MGREYSFEFKESYVLIGFNENPDLEILIAVLKELHSLEEYKTRNGLWDFRKLEVRLGYDDMRKLRKFVEENYKSHGVIKRTALVVDSDVSYGLARMYDALTEHIPTEVQIFTDFSEAKKWVND